jgi:hypothetical protein
MAKNPTRPPWCERRPGELDPDDVAWGGEPFEPGELETLGEVVIDGKTYVEVRFHPWYHFKAAGITEESVETFASEHAIKDFHALCQALALVARAVAETQPYSTHALLWHDRHFDAAAEDLATLDRAKALVEALGELVSGEIWPVAMTKESVAFRRTLIKYRRHLEQFDVVVLPGVEGRPSDEKTKEAFAVWTWAWPLLTGSAPEVRRPRPDQPPTSGRPPLGPTPFQHAFGDVCRLFGLGVPSPATLERWLKRPNG